MRGRGLVGDEGWLSEAGRRVKAHIETTTDELAAPAYDVLGSDALAQLIEDLEPLAARLAETGST